MKLNRKVYVVGGDLTTFIGKSHPDFIWKRHPDFGTRENPTLEGHLTAAINGALEKTGVDAAQIDKGYIGNFAGGLFSNQGHLGSMAVRANEAFNGKPFMRVEGACASGALAAVAAVDALQAGYDVVLVAGAEVQTTVSAREGAAFLATASHYETERELDDFTFPAMFARRNKAYKEKYGVTDADVAHVVAKAYSNGNKNPYAHMRAVKVDHATASAPSDTNPNFLKNEDLKDHLKVTDCSQVSDGGAAIILATEDGLKRLGKTPADCIELVAYAHTTAPLGKVEDFTSLTTTRQAIEQLYAEAGITADDVQVAEVHDCFHIAEVQMTEALGFAEPGKGTQAARDGVTAIDGKHPINTGGGLIAFGHPVGATGVKQILEIYRQMKGLCGDYQIPTPPKVGVTANMGGDDRTAVAMAFKNT